MDRSNPLPSHSGHSSGYLHQSAAFASHISTKNQYPYPQYYGMAVEPVDPLIANKTFSEANGYHDDFLLGPLNQREVESLTVFNTPNTPFTPWNLTDDDLSIREEYVLSLLDNIGDMDNTSSAESTAQAEHSARNIYIDTHFSNGVHGSDSFMQAYKPTGRDVASACKKTYPCDQCDKSYLKKTSLKVHKYQHGGQKPYPCDQCNKSYVYESILKIHQRTHTGEKPYQCSQCHKSYTSNSSLKRHHRRIHTSAARR